MGEWLKANLGSIIILIVLALIVAFAIWQIIRKKKQGKSNCSCGCSNCAMQGICHKDKTKNQAKDKE